MKQICFISEKYLYLQVNGMNMTLHEAFGELIKQLGWYKNSGVIRQVAVRDKRLFLSGKSIPEERMRQYLRIAGWIQTQQEQWAENRNK